MKYCETFAALLDPFIDGELSPDEMARVQAHLNVCPACRAYVDDALAIRAAFPDAEDTALPEGFAESVMARVRAETPVQKKPSRPWLKALASLAACCAIVLLAAPMFSHSSKTEAAPAEAPAAAAAPTERAMGFAYTAEEAPAEESAGEPRNDLASSKLYDDAPAPSAAADSGATAYGTEDNAASTLTLPPEAASLLADFTPVEETDTEARYELSRQAWDALTESLSQAGIPCELEDTGADTVLVILKK